jgi:AcrR family transcriptional regulator
VIKNGIVDRRVSRTRVALRKALIDLILEKDYDDITVQHILDRAVISRSTFYGHYRGKEDAFRQEWQRLLGFIASPLNFQEPTSGRVAHVKELFEHMAEMHSLYRSLVKSGKSEQLYRTGVKELAAVCEDKLRQQNSRKKTWRVDPAITAHVFASALFGTLRWWLENDMPHSPQEMDDAFHKLIGCGVQNSL